MNLSQRCGASFVPFLSRLVLGFVFATYGYHLCFHEVSYDDQEARQLQALGFDVGPAVVSTPEVQRYSGWPGHRLPSWRNCLMSSRGTESEPSRSYFGLTARTPERCKSA